MKTIKLFATAVASLALLASPLSAAHSTPQATGLTYEYDAAPSGNIRPASVMRASLPAGVDPFTLSSRPTAPVTLYLDFDGATLSQTSWNTDPYYPISDPATFPGYSQDADPAFNANEKDVIYTTWLETAQFYSPFNINVTTKAPDMNDIIYTGSNDARFGAVTIFTSDKTQIAAQCGCAGIGPKGGITIASDHLYAQIAFVFTNVLRDNGDFFARVAAHEVGHLFGLMHHGYMNEEYVQNDGIWSALMGASYYSKLAQWSDGTYVGATNAQDDIAIISSVAPLVPDDIGADNSTATPLTSGVPTNATISTRNDTDRFALSASGTTTVTVRPVDGNKSLSATVSVLNKDGAVLATVGPDYVALLNNKNETTVTVELPATSADIYYIDVAGGALPATATPKTLDSFTNYGSVGGYTITATTKAPLPALAIKTTTLTAARSGQTYSAKIASNRSTAVTYTIVNGALPKGLKLNANTGAITGKAAKVTKTTKYTFTVQLSDGTSTASKVLTLTVKK